MNVQCVYMSSTSMCSVLYTYMCNIIHMYIKNKNMSYYFKIRYFLYYTSLAL